MTQSIKFTPKPNEKELLDGLVQSGGYKSSQHALSAGLEALNSHGAKLQRLREMIRAGDNSGAAVEVDRKKRLEELRRKSRNV
ncbi:ribbon-helix-helix domain-containing protein [Agarilytica rhodophyticola]|uniref:ribbon-helix-helix domain-containing protein n=1 Tax=Agarilytica rhodophyticola TaxID=1737490 RepID=UPI000B343668|nr:type II toxin-antitoxin system ParD family antitoxin [Agarilytica rhodophyticola]